MLVLGLYLDGDYFKVALLSCRGKKIKIELLEEFRKEVIHQKQLEKRFRKIAKGRKLDIVSAISSESVFFKQISLPLKRESAIYKALPFQMESTWAFAKKEVIVAPLIYPAKRSSQIALHGFSEETMKCHLEQMQEIGFDPSQSSTTSHALSRFAEFFVSEYFNLCILHFGWESSFLITTIDQREASSTNLSLGFKHLIDAIKTDFPEIEDLSDGTVANILKQVKKNPDKNASVSKFLNTFQSEISRAKGFFNKIQKEELIFEGVLFTGYADKGEVLCKAIEVFDLPFVNIHPHLEYSKQDLLAYALEIGLSLDVLQGDQKTLQLRRGKFTPESVIKRAKKKILAAAFSSFLCSSILALGLAFFIGSKEKEAKDRFLKIATLVDGSVENFPKLNKKWPTELDYSIEARNLLIKLQKRQKQTLPVKKGPFVLDLLSWLIEQKESDICIEDIAYETTDYPEIEKPEENYQYSLKIGFCAPSESSAKTFVQSLTTEAPKGSKIAHEAKYDKEENRHTLTLYFDYVEEASF